MVVHCFNRSVCGLRFLFQGTGYTELFNSVYRNTIMERRVPLGQVPIEMNKYTDRKEYERIRDINKVARTLKAEVGAMNYFNSHGSLDRFMQEFTNHGVSLFLHKSYKNSTYWHISSFSLVHPLARSSSDAELLQNGVAYFKHVKLKMECDESNKAEVLVWYHSGVLRAACSCLFLRSDGLPCGHLTKLTLTYPDFVKTNLSVKSFLGTEDLLTSKYSSTRTGSVTVVNGGNRL